MGENQERRRARRQQRGRHRVEEILRVAGAIFAEVGYDKATTTIIATRAGISPGSLYQFFPNKDAITQAYAAYATDRLHRIYDTILASEVITLPLRAFLDRFIDAIIAFNRADPGYLALSMGSTISPTLAHVLAELQQSIADRLDALLAARWPQSTPEQRRLPILVTYRLFLALLPLALQSDGEQQQAIVQEMKAVFYRYWEPIIGAQ